MLNWISHLECKAETFFLKNKNDSTLKSAAEAAAKGGVITVPGAILGAIYGGVHVRLFNLTGRGIITFTTVVQVLAALFFGLSCFITC